MLAQSSEAISSRRAKFLAEHPICCFCGGKAAAIEMDHVPGRAVFKGRSWPEGYVFPACTPCNQKTRLDEMLFSFLCRMHPDPSSERDRNEMAAIIKSIENNFPGILKLLTPSAREVRRFLKKSRVPLPRGMALSEVPILKTDHPTLRNSVRQAAKKLALALFYKHSSRIVPPDGAIAIAFFTNVTFKPNEWPVELFQVFSGLPTLKRASHSLEDQFNYQYAIGSDAEFAGFLIRFPTSAAFLIAVDCRGEQKYFQENDDFGRWIERPFVHSAT